MEERRAAMRNRLGNIFMILGMMLVLAALSFFVFNKYQDYQADKAAQERLPKIKQVIEQNQQNNTINDPYAMRVANLDGEKYIGYIFIPSVGVELPVMSEWNYTNLMIAPCRYFGSTKEDNLVIAGHNYTRHFGPIHRCSIGDKIWFTDMDGVTTTYEVVAKDVLLPSAVEEMTSGEYDLTLFTCTYGGQSRITIRCNRVN